LSRELGKFNPQQRVGTHRDSMYAGIGLVSLPPFRVRHLDPERSSTMTSRHMRAIGGLLWAAPCIALAQAQATIKPDGQFRYALGAGLSYASGNTDAKSLNISGDGVRATDDSKWQIGGKALRSSSEGVKTAENYALGTQYNRDVTPLWFGFGKADFLRDRLANVSSRVSLFGGVGRHLVKTDALTWDVSAGLGYTQDRYDEPADVAGEIRTRYGRPEALLAEESTHKWTSTTTFHQKLELYPGLRGGSGYRGVFDSGLSVAMTSTLSLTAGLNYRYNSDPGEGLKKGDTLFVTGIALKID
jgi:putative salt-induced outer membrane protein YdiY